MRYNIIRETDISNGPGIRVSLFTQGCFHKCKDCFNPETWDITGGNEFTYSEIEKILKLMDRDYIDGLSILGGDPFIYYDVNYKEKDDMLFQLVKAVKDTYKSKDIWVWTGYLWENCFPDKNGRILLPDIKNVLKNINVLVDGPYIDNLYHSRLAYRGSTNQRVIDVQKSIESGELTLYEKKKI